MKEQNILNTSRFKDPYNNKLTMWLDENVGEINIDWKLEWQCKDEIWTIYLIIMDDCKAIMTKLYWNT